MPELRFACHAATSGVPLPVCAETRPRDIGPPNVHPDSHATDHRPSGAPVTTRSPATASGILVFAGTAGVAAGSRATAQARAWKLVRTLGPFWPSEMNRMTRGRHMTNIVMNSMSCWFVVRAAPGLPEAGFGWLRCHGLGFQSCAAVCFGFGRRDIPDRIEDTAVVEPVHPYRHGVFHCSKLRHGPRRWMTSGRNRPSIVSAKALP